MASVEIGGQVLPSIAQLLDLNLISPQQAWPGAEVSSTRLYTRAVGLVFELGSCEQPLRCEQTTRTDPCTQATASENLGELVQPFTGKLKSIRLGTITRDRSPSFPRLGSLTQTSPLDTPRENAMTNQSAPAPSIGELLCPTTKSCSLLHVLEMRCARALSNPSPGCEMHASMRQFTPLQVPETSR
eukprot:6207739-Pleurochrysis_carterae.AAC.1